MVARALLALCGTTLFLGVACIPYPTSPDGTPIEGGYSGARALSVTIPSGTRTVPEGTLVDIKWTTYNDTTVTATVTVVVEARPSLEETVLAADQAVPAGSASRSLQWDTADFDAVEYVIRVRLIVDHAVEKEVTADGKITIDGAPEFRFILPTTDVTLAPSDTIDISWGGMDPEAEAEVRIGVDLDEDHTSGNEIYIHEDTLTAESIDESLQWDGEDLDGTRVDAGTYYIFAVIDDSVNDAAIETAAGRVIVTD